MGVSLCDNIIILCTLCSQKPCWGQHEEMALTAAGPVFFVEICGFLLWVHWVQVTAFGWLGPSSVGTSAVVPLVWVLCKEGGGLKWGCPRPRELAWGGRQTTVPELSLLDHMNFELLGRRTKSRRTLKITRVKGLHHLLTPRSFYCNAIAPYPNNFDTANEWLCKHWRNTY